MGHAQTGGAVAGGAQSAADSAKSAAALASDTASGAATAAIYTAKQAGQAATGTAKQAGNTLVGGAQATVEGLSVAAITYYIMGLIDHLTKAAQSLALINSPDVANAISLPFVVAFVWWAIHTTHQRVFKN